MEYKDNLDKHQLEYYLNYLKKEGIYTEKLYQEGIKRIKNKEPIQYIIGNVDFYGYKIKVNKNVLIPRFETELLVEKTIKYINKIFNTPTLTLADLGTGSGCIAIALKNILPNLEIDAYDISKQALYLASINAKNNNANIKFIKKDITKPLTKKYNIIISNPPYISYTEPIMDIVKDNEPHIALYAKNNGLYFYEAILKNIDITPPFLIAFEIGYKQADKIKYYANKYLNNIEISVEKDYSNKDRYIFIYNKNE